MIKKIIILVILGTFTLVHFVLCDGGIYLRALNAVWSAIASFAG